MNKETIEQIEKDAEERFSGHLFTNERRGYEIGATAQHPKAWNAAIDACAAHIRSYADIHNCVVKELESLKLDPNQA